MYRATFISSYYDKYNNMIEYEYEYKGQHYTVEVNRSKGNLPLYMQHRNAQDRIDRIIESDRSFESTGPSVEDCLNSLLDYWEQ